MNCPYFIIRCRINLPPNRENEWLLDRSQCLKRVKSRPDWVSMFSPMPGSMSEQ